MSKTYPDPSLPHPIVQPDGTALEGTVFLRAVIDHPHFIVGDYTYASAFDPPADWAERLAPYLFPNAPERLVIGKFCQIADGVQFITSSANHRFDGISSFPFAIFDGGFAADRPSLPGPGPDTRIGNDVWIGQGARLMPGVMVGDGAIIGAGAVVTGTVPAYAVVAGNPARVVRTRFPEDQVARLQRISWWDWPINQILEYEAAICGADIDALERAAP